MSQAIAKGRPRAYQNCRKDWANEGIVRERRGERSYIVETPSAVLRRNRVHLLSVPPLMACSNPSARYEAEEQHRPQRSAQQLWPPARQQLWPPVRQQLAPSLLQLPQLPQLQLPQRPDAAPLSHPPVPPPPNTSVQQTPSAVPVSPKKTRSGVHY